MDRRAELVFIPCPEVGHLMSTVEFARLLVNRDEGLSVAVLVMKLSDNCALRAIIDSASASSSTVRIRFIELPEPELRNASGRLVNSHNMKWSCLYVRIERNRLDFLYRLWCLCGPP